MKKIKKRKLPNSITEIFITGGPSGGKTTGIKKLVKWLTRQGFRVLVGREKATDMINGGVQDINEIAKNNPKLYEYIEEQMLLWQLDDQKRMRALAKSFVGQSVVIIYDRGPIDVKAYLSIKVFMRILRRNKLSMTYLRNQGQGVIHLVSAAIGAEKFYNTTNNKARREGLKEARKADFKTLHAWIGHPHLMIIDNKRSKNFKHKMQRLLQAVCRIIGVPAMIEIERKFLIEKKPNFNHTLLKNAPCTEIEQMYLEETANGRWRIRKSTHDKHISYCKTLKKRISALTREENEITITKEEYEILKNQRDRKLKVIRKKRYWFCYQHQYFSLDIFQSPRKLYLLEIELAEEGDAVQLPDFLKIKKEVTADPKFSNSSIATKTLH